MKLRLAALTLCLCLLFSLVPTVSATESAQAAEDMTQTTVFSGIGFDSTKFLHDGNTKTYKRSAGNAKVTLENEKGIGALYLLFDLEYGEYTITDNATGCTITAGSRGYLHEYVDLTALNQPTSVTITFDNGPVRLSEIFVFSPGQTPDFVQRWDAPLDGKADMVLFCSHGDDDHLFFAGLLPLYAVEKDCAVQVVYLTDHRNNTKERTHEMLNGLWAVGIRAYPVFGGFNDFRIDSLEGTYKEYADQGVTQDDLLEFVTEQIRRFKPQVAVGHDLKGEYGHGMHMVYADLLTKAVEISNDPEKFPEQAKRYGLWDVPKTYLHLYEENQITIDYDQPLDSLNGMTAFEVSQKLGYPCHKSQQYTWFTGWINGKKTPITKASQIETHNPCQFGLYRSTVGEDVAKNDFMENLLTYQELERLEQERLEQERLEQERLEQERLEQERLEQERLEQERLEQERLEQERIEKENLQKKEQLKEQDESSQNALTAGIVMLIALIILLIIVVVTLVKRLRKRPKK
ncbi:MAG: hypothetical protein E7466_04845 [Ruminococcaceae bacterium]|nr:hypothetical protein [Oscillospiraceae bacterium]